MSVINIYFVVILTAVMRTVLLIHILLEEKLLSVQAYNFVYVTFRISLTGLWYMQIPIVIERVCATVFYRTYPYWKCYPTVFCILVMWILNIIGMIGVIRIPQTLTLILLAVGNIASVVIYTALVKINISRYKNGQAIQNLQERHQLFENMKSLYPIVWTVAIEMLYNIKSVIVVGIFITVIAPSNDVKLHMIEDGISNILREILLLTYCIPFLVFNERRQKARFLSQVTTENRNESALYFQQLQKQWSAV
uniref:G_PROTEIN_RECEP_F1_2 domain-containing protein n=1 Tax=Panagrellus redivivus TaxID=6233 RepID=A0A7E4VUX3_PANRE